MPENSSKSSMLVCFAVKEELAFFTPPGNVRTLLTGMGKHNAATQLRAALAERRASCVLTCGFVGALNPTFRIGDVLYDADSESELGERLERAGARRAQFHFVTRVLITGDEKRHVFQETKADAVEMESKIIREICAGQGIPSATVRVISDTAHEDLPLDFNRLMTPEQKIDFFKLALAIAKAPQTIPKLMRFQKQTQEAARSLATVLNKFLPL